MRLRDAEAWNQIPSDWQRFLSASPEGCFVMEHQGRVAGTITTISYERRFAWIGMLLVDKRYRGQGIGTALLKHAVSYLDSQGVTAMKRDATPQGRLLARMFRGSNTHTGRPDLLCAVLGPEFG